MISLAYRNIAGYVVTLAGFTVGTLSYFVPAEFLGESERLKGLAWLLAGIVMVAPDASSLLRRNKGAWLTRWTGGWIGLPVWVAGIVAIAGGVYFLLSLGV